MKRSETIQLGGLQRFCVQDGPGIRTTVFLQGCPLRCWWCHNPGMQPAGGGRAVTVDELLQDVLRDARYWKHSGGGITLSGGEPLLQAEACIAFLAAVQASGYGGCVETSGYATPGVLDAVDGVTDLWLFDLKTLDPATFRHATRGDLGGVLQNLRTLLCRRAESVWVRIPLIRGHNDEEGSLAGMGEFLAGLPSPARIQLLPGHGLSVAGRKKAAVDAATCRWALSVLRRFCAHVEICG